MLDDSRLKKKTSSPRKSGRGKLNLIWSKTLSALVKRGEFPDEIYVAKLNDVDEHYFAFATLDEISPMVALYGLRKNTVPENSERHNPAK
jgi:hypothetical protein